MRISQGTSRGGTRSERLNPFSPIKPVIVRWSEPRFSRDRICSDWMCRLGVASWAKNGRGWGLSRLGTRVSFCGHESCYILAVSAVGTVGNWDGIMVQIETLSWRVPRIEKSKKVPYPISRLGDVRGAMGLNGAGKSRRARTPLASEGAHILEIGNPPFERPSRVL